MNGHHSSTQQATSAHLRTLSRLQHQQNEPISSQSIHRRHVNIFEHLADPPKNKEFDQPDHSVQLPVGLDKSTLDAVIPHLPNDSLTLTALPDVTSVEASTMAQRESGQLTKGNQAENPIKRVIETLHRQAFGFRPTYIGDVLNPANRPDQVPLDQNCNLWITNLPGDCSEAELEHAVRNVGSIWAMSFNPPELGRERRGSAAALSFTRVESAREFMSRTRGKGFHIRGRRARVSWNRNRVGPQPLSNESHVQRSRILIISGPAVLVNKNTLGDFFGRYFTYRTTGIEVRGQDVSGRTVTEWRFARVTGQANIAATCLRALKEEHDIDIEFSWGVDPCEVIERLV